MKKYYVHWNGLAFAGTAYGYSKRDVERTVREQYGLKGKHIGFTCWLAE